MPRTSDASESRETRTLLESCSNITCITWPLDTFWAPKNNHGGQRRLQKRKNMQHALVRRSLNHHVILVRFVPWNQTRLPSTWIHSDMPPESGTRDAKIHGRVIVIDAVNTHPINGTMVDGKWLEIAEIVQNATSTYHRKRTLQAINSKLSRTEKQSTAWLKNRDRGRNKVAREATTVEPVNFVLYVIAKLKPGQCARSRSPDKCLTLPLKHFKRVARLYQLENHPSILVLIPTTSSTAPIGERTHEVQGYGLLVKLV